uniref:Uncharacterized protein n=1 Tax=Meloidogyne javanica TaxID=6303 RepID=A0A915LMR7_MELJA
MSDNLQGVDDDLVSTLCSCSTINFEDSVEKDKMNMAFQLILAKLDLVGEDFEKLKEENEKIFKEKIELIGKLKEINSQKEKYEEDKKLELINLAKLKNTNEEIFKEKTQLLKEFKEYKIKMTKIEEVNKSKLTKIEEDYKKLTKKSEISENIISQLRQEISQNKKNYKQEIKVN